MIFLLIDAPQDRLMAYQHTKRTQFVTHRGVDKLFGAERMAEQLGVALRDSVGAGDAETDTFLRGVGLAVVVGPNALEMRGHWDTLHVADHRDLGELLGRLAESTPPR
jgi:hydroxymethylpyrimidine pyrophosphatase-like HAD family hydrolase